MQRAILATHEWINSRISRGETWMTEDPFIFKRGVGAYITAQSVRHHKLTWTDLLITLEGLHQALYEEGRFNQVRFDIHYTGNMVMVGTGTLVKERVDSVGIQ